MKKLLLFTLQILFFMNLYAQHSIEGVVLDLVNLEPIGYATITNNLNHKVVAFTNELGEFKYSSNDTLNVQLLIKCIGYKSKIINIYGFKHTKILIEKSENELNEVVIKNINYNTLFTDFIEKLKQNKSNSLNVKSFYRLYSSNQNQIYEAIEGFYSSIVKPNTFKNLSIENGRFAFFDSLLNQGFISSLDLSNLLLNFDLLNIDNSTSSIFPIVPLYDFNELKYVTKKVISSTFNGTEKIVEYSIVPNEKFKRKIFNCSIWIGQKTLNIKKIKLTIFEPQKSTLLAINDKSLCIIDSISITEIFNEFNSKISFPEQLNIKINYTLKNFEKTNVLTTNISIVNYEINSNPFIEKQETNLTDREKIDKILYEPLYWKNVNNYLKNTDKQSQDLAILESLNLFGNPLLTNTDTLNYLSNIYTYCKNNSKIQLTNFYKPENPLNILTLRKGKIPVAEYYFVIYFTYSIYNNQFNFRSIPLFYHYCSWYNKLEISENKNEQILTVLSDLTVYYTDLLNFRLNEMLASKQDYKNILIEKDRILNKYYEKQEDFLKTFWQ